MGRLHTHYENLMVAHNAPPEVIRVAYKALAQRYHPDVNSSADAPRIMKILNASYAVLSDPGLRAAHDAWIEEQLIQEATEEASGPAEPGLRTPRETSDPTSMTRPSLLDRFNSGLTNASSIAYVGFGCALIAFIVWGVGNAPTRDRPPTRSSPTSEPEQLYVGDPRLDASPPPTLRSNSSRGTSFLVKLYSYSSSMTGVDGGRSCAAKSKC
jgi:hypothetical protein